MICISKISWMALCLLLVMAVPCQSVEVGEPIPDFVTQTFDGRVITRSTLAGRPALLVFWNTWCDVCKRNLPKINRVARNLPPERVTILAINTGLNDNEKKARDYWKHYGYIFPTGYDRLFGIRKDFRVQGVPTIYLIDSRGVVRYRNAAPPDDLEQRLLKLRD